MIFYVIDQISRIRYLKSIVGYSVLRNENKNKNKNKKWIIMFQKRIKDKCLWPIYDLLMQ